MDENKSAFCKVSGHREDSSGDKRGLSLYSPHLWCLGKFSQGWIKPQPNPIIIPALWKWWDTCKEAVPPGRYWTWDILSPVFSPLCTLEHRDPDVFMLLYQASQGFPCPWSPATKGKMLIFSSSIAIFLFPTLAPWPGRFCKKKAPWSCTALGSI